MIQNKQYLIPKSEIKGFVSLPDKVGSLDNDYMLRWYISAIEADQIKIEATTLKDGFMPFDQGVNDQIYPGKSVVLSIIPTGIECQIGGYAGDAAPVTNLLASATDYLITNPNAVNASNFISLRNNVVYTEGYSIDLFSKGRVNLFIPHANRVGLIIEKSDKTSLDMVFNIINTVRAVHGVAVTDYVITDKPIGSRCVRSQSGAFTGTIDNPKVLFDACEQLLQRGVTAIAITSNVQELPLEIYAEHFAGQCPNPVGGVEAVISHLITNQFQVPAAHAPLLNEKRMALSDAIVDARGAGEMASLSGLACILIGLHRAPQLKVGLGRIKDIININNLIAVVTPIDCLGSIPVLQAQKYRIPVLAVRDNSTILDVTQIKMQLDNVIEVSSYAEAAGIILALKEGIHLEAISRPLTKINLGLLNQCH
ncbi:hypothetical protein PN36_18620 [Candidatus Thiomargarita nelsonii]|uniref:DUF3326 domain-containing protein n=1 Tax=Candidatus Thiomargarita nelsonii TaxID=1003181 RepID=A0A4E0R2J9_9GAMM|nr:hypothetical protein PN36_18620 [Candidatus Thiomargarita nelsonii]